tara:strand:- start:4361 stop:5173 length:813 start_codon:yes stop_codon:yes gene_type:complete
VFFKSILKGLVLFIFVVSVNAQETPISEIFFLDLGIVIEPKKGTESYSRVISKTSKEKTFKIKKVESGSVYMASSKELLTTLNRINDRIAELESSFHTELGSLKKENRDLRETLATISTQEVYVSNDLPIKKAIITEINHKPAPKFDRANYMSGVFAYQREDYKMALNYFTSVNIELAPDKTAENILYWMADAYQQSADYENALMLLNQIAISGNLRIDDALVKKGLVHRKRGEEQLALAAFNNVVVDHPNSEYVRLAQMELKNLRDQNK